MKKIAALSLTAMIAVCLLVYVVDYLLWRYKLATGHGHIWHRGGAILLRH